MRTSLYYYIDESDFIMKRGYSRVETVKEILEWKNNKNESLEDKFFTKKEKLEWDKTDVLYSFLGIYVFGLRAYYPDKFRCTEFQIRTEKGRNAYSNKYIFYNYTAFAELNELEELKNFIENYLTLGNLIPIWPGGNVHRGQSQCFDIPEIYFSKYKKMAEALVNVYKNAYMKDIVRNKMQIDVPKLLVMKKEEYKEFLKYIVSTIQDRDYKLMEALNKKEFRKDIF